MPKRFFAISPPANFALCQAQILHPYIPSESPKNIKTNETIYAPPIDAGWIIAGLCHWLCASNNHGKPVNKKDLTHSSATQKPAKNKSFEILLAKLSDGFGTNFFNAKSHTQKNSATIADSPMRNKYPDGGYTNLSHAKSKIHEAHAPAKAAVFHNLSDNFHECAAHNRKAEKTYAPSAAQNGSKEIA